MCVCVCIYTDIYIYIQIYIYTHTHTPPTYKICPTYCVAVLQFQGLNYSAKINKYCINIVLNMETATHLQAMLEH